jgi:hypothetical protein
VSDFTGAVEAFDGAIRRTLETCRSLPPDRWNSHAPGRRHSIGEVVEHMALSNRLFQRRLRSILDGAPVDQPYSSLEDAEVPHLFERASEPPGIAEPTGEWRDRDAALSLFAESARPISEMAKEAVGDLRMKGAPHPVFGRLDGLQWALFAAAHNERHRSEIIGLAVPPSSAPAA